MFRGTAKRWTVTDDRQLLQLGEQGISDAVIAQTLGRSVTAIRSRLSILKSLGQLSTRHQSPPWTPEEDESLLSLVEAGASWSQIADEINRPVGGVRHRAI